MLVGLYASYPQAGKSSVAQYLVKHYDFAQVKFADTLKKMAYVFLSDLGIENPEEYIEGSRKEEVLPHIWVTTRWIMQSIGTEWARDQIHRDTWLFIVRQKIKQHEKVVIDDLRFPNEYDMLKDMMAFLVKIERPGYSQKVNHQSEGSLDEMSFDLVLVNDGSLVDLYNQIESILIPKLEARFFHTLQ